MVVNPMFVISIKSKDLKKYSLCVLAGVLVTIGGVYAVSATPAQVVTNLNGIVLTASTDEERIAFLSQFGWEIEEEAIEVKEIVIPTEFDDVYWQYNELQVTQNFDLTQYYGARVKLWKYEIKNYPGYEDTDGIIQANLLVLDGVVIAGDVSSIELGGFMHTFEMPD